MDREREPTLRYSMDVEGLTAPDARKEERERNQAYTHVIHERLPWLDQRTQTEGLQASLRIHYVRFGVMRRRACDEALRATLTAPADALTDGSCRQVFGPLTYLGVLAVAYDGRGLAFNPLGAPPCFRPVFRRPARPA